jgi:branched-subunit amino acid ABC-type transport system permease component
MTVVASFLGIDSTREVGQALVNGVINGSAYALLGMAWGLIYGVVRRFHFALAFTYALAAFIASVVHDQSGFALMLAILVGLAVSVLAGVLIELGYQGLARKVGAAALLPIFVISLGITIAGTNALQLIWGLGTRTLTGFSISNISIGSVTLTSLELSLVILGMVSAVATTALVAWTPFGRQMKAVRSNAEMATAVGINPNRIYLYVFAIASLLAGVAAIYDGMRFAVSADMGQQPLFYALVVSFLVGSARTPLLIWCSGIFVGLVESVSTLWLSTHYSTVVVFGLLLLFVSWRSVQVGLARYMQPLVDRLRSLGAIVKPGKTA